MRLSYFLLLLFLASCSEIKTSKYQDTTYLETPPAMAIIEKPKVVEPKQEEKVVDKGLGEQVSIAGTSQKPLIKIKKMFERSWDIVEQALKLNKIEITDKNRDEGFFYVKFDPDDEGSELLDNVTFFFFEDEYEEAAYKLTVGWQESDTEVEAELVNENNMDIVDEEKGDFDGSVDAGAKLIKQLYKTIRDDLPLD